MLSLSRSWGALMLGGVARADLLCYVCYVAAIEHAGHGKFEAPASWSLESAAAPTAVARCTDAYLPTLRLTRRFDPEKADYMYMYCKL